MENHSWNSKYWSPDWIGKKFNKLTVLDIERVQQGKYVRWMWTCKCDCGNVKKIRGEYVVSGHTKSCGCNVLNNKSAMTHGESKTRLHMIWARMRERCSKTLTSPHKRYAGRGIKVCKEWDNYEAFASWAMSNGYNDTLSIERINNNWGYCPENCKWIERGLQARNRRTTMWVEYNGERMSLAEACEIAGMPYKQVFARIRYMDWSVEDALSIPMNTTRKWKRSERFSKKLSHKSGQLSMFDKPYVPTLLFDGTPQVTDA